MNDLIFVSLIAATAMLLAWGVCQIALNLAGAEKRKLQQRLSQGVSLPRDTARSITLQSDVRGLSAVLIRYRLFAALYRSLVQACPDLPLARFLGIVLATAVGAFALGGVFMNSLVVGTLAAVLGAYAPFLVLSARRNRRQRLLAEELPDALDFLARILRAGHSLSTGLQMVGAELPEPLAAEFRRCYDQHSLGLPLDDALKDMADRLDSTDFAFFVTAVLVQRQTGGDLAEVLDNISRMIRQRIRLSQHVKAKTAEGRFTGYILVAFPVLMFLIYYVMSPAQAEIMFQTATGLSLLGVAVVLEAVGLYAIRKITTVKV